MEFKEIVQKQFERAGWSQGRNVRKNFEDKIQNFNSTPIHVKEFLSSYGNLVIEDCNPDNSEVINTLDTDIRYVERMIEDEMPFSDQLYRIGYYYPDHYMVYTDKEGAVYLIGDSYLKISNDFKIGIENLMEDDWANTLEWNFETNEWVNEY